MIVCETCLNKNPIGTRYCRQCGAKITVKHEQIVQAVGIEMADATARRWYHRGHGMVVLGGFMLFGSLVLRYAMVPAMPPADIIPVTQASVLPDKPVVVAGPPPPEPVPATAAAPTPTSATAAASTPKPATAAAAAPAAKSATAAVPTPKPATASKPNP